MNVLRILSVWVVTIMLGCLWAAGENQGVWEMKQELIELLNESFSDPDLTGWHVPHAEGVSGVHDADVGRSASGSVKLMVASSVTPGFPNFSWLTSAQPGQLLVLTGYVRTEGVTDGYGAYLVMEAIRSDGSRIHFYQSPGVVGDSDWKKLEAVSILPAETTQVRVNLTLNGHGTAWYDDIQLIHNSHLDVSLDPLPASSQIIIHTDQVNQEKLWGFGFEDDPFYYTSLNAERGVTPQQMERKDQRVEQLMPGWIRSFVWWKAINPSGDWQTIDLDTDDGKSLLRTWSLYQKLGVKILLCDVSWEMSFPYRLGYEEQTARFYARLVDWLRREKGLTAIRGVTLTNEPDLVWNQLGGNEETYRNAHRVMREELDRLGHQEVELVGGDTTLDWEFLRMTMRQAGDFCSAWSIHKYLTNGSEQLLAYHLLDALQAQQETSQKEPLILAEFGFSWPETSDQNHTGIRLPEYGLSIAGACVDVLNYGLSGASIWCLCAQYYSGVQFVMDFGLWGYAGEDFQPRPVCHAYSLFTRFVRPGDHSILVKSPKGLKTAAVGDPVSGLRVLYLVNPTSTSTELQITGLPSGKYRLFRYHVDQPNLVEDVLLLPSEVVETSGTVPLNLPIVPKSMLALVHEDRFRVGGLIQVQ